MDNRERLKIVTVMNFVRQCEPRDEASEKALYPTTEKQLEYVTEAGFDNTFLLQYDAVCDEKFVNLFKTKATERTELGLWYEIVEPLTFAVGLEFRSEYGWKWDWHIIPGFSMAYTPEEREKLIDQAMKKFKETFGYYPRTVGSWLIDTHTMNYLAEHYDIDTICICRDQTNTDAYTLVGGYFNQAYYPSKNNIFTPAQTEEFRVNIPVFRLLGPSPIHNYDGEKYLSEGKKGNVCVTLEVAWEGAKNEKMVDWFFRTYYDNEDLGFSYSQLGQENSFGLSDLVTPLKMQINLLKQHRGVRFLKMCDAGRAFKEKYKEKTPATCVSALDNWDEDDIQSVYYDCTNYVANIFRHKEKLFFRGFYLFDERVEDHYLKTPCKRFDAVYENLPIVDTAVWSEGEKDEGMIIDENASAFEAEKTGESELLIRDVKGNRIARFSEEGIEVYSDTLKYLPKRPAANITLSDEGILYEYMGVKYALNAENAKVSEPAGNGEIVIEKANKDRPIILKPERK